MDVPNGHGTVNGPGLDTSDGRTGNSASGAAPPCPAALAPRIDPERLFQDPKRPKLAIATGKPMLSEGTAKISISMAAGGHHPYASRLFDEDDASPNMQDSLPSVHSSRIGNSASSAKTGHESSLFTDSIARGSSSSRSSSRTSPSPAPSFSTATRSESISSNHGRDSDAHDPSRQFSTHQVSERVSRDASRHSSRYSSRDSSRDRYPISSRYDTRGLARDHCDEYERRGEDRRCDSRSRSRGRDRRRRYSTSRSRSRGRRRRYSSSRSRSRSWSRDHGRDAYSPARRYRHSRSRSRDRHRSSRGSGVGDTRRREEPSPRRSRSQTAQPMIIKHMTIDALDQDLQQGWMHGEKIAGPDGYRTQPESSWSASRSLETLVPDPRRSSPTLSSSFSQDLPRAKLKRFASYMYVPVELLPDENRVKPEATPREENIVLSGCDPQHTRESFLLMQIEALLIQHALFRQRYPEWAVDKEKIPFPPLKVKNVTKEREEASLMKKRRTALSPTPPAAPAESFSAWLSRRVKVQFRLDKQRLIQGGHVKLTILDPLVAYCLSHVARLAHHASDPLLPAYVSSSEASTSSWLEYVWDGPVPPAVEISLFWRKVTIRRDLDGKLWQALGEQEKPAVTPLPPPPAPIDSQMERSEPSSPSAELIDPPRLKRILEDHLTDALQQWLRRTLQHKLVPHLVSLYLAERRTQDRLTAERLQREREEAEVALRAAADSETDGRWALSARFRRVAQVDESESEDSESDMSEVTSMNDLEDNETSLSSQQAESAVQDTDEPELADGSMLDSPTSRPRSTPKSPSKPAIRKPLVPKASAPRKTATVTPRREHALLPRYNTRHLKALEEALLSPSPELAATPPIEDDADEEADSAIESRDDPASAAIQCSHLASAEDSLQKLFSHLPPCMHDTLRLVPYDEEKLDKRRFTWIRSGAGDSSALRRVRRHDLPYLNDEARSGPLTSLPSSALSSLSLTLGSLNMVPSLSNRPKWVRLDRSKIHAWGLFAMERIQAGDFIIAYVGQVIPSLIAAKREAMYDAMIKGEAPSRPLVGQAGAQLPMPLLGRTGSLASSYLFALDLVNEWAIDATLQGNRARFLNHSCEANVAAKTVTVPLSGKDLTRSLASLSLTDAPEWRHTPLEEMDAGQLLQRLVDETIRADGLEPESAAATVRKRSLKERFAQMPMEMQLAVLSPHATLRTSSYTSPAPLAKQIHLYAQRTIQPGEELTYNYHFTEESNPDARVRCLCGAPSCRGYLN